MMNKTPNYKVFTYKNEKGLNVVKVGSTYAGRPVWGYAVCAPEDDYNYDYGYALAKARCDKKIAEQRLNRAQAKMDYYYKLIMSVNRAYNDACDYYENSYQAYKDADREYCSLLTEKA